MPIYNVTTTIEREVRAESPEEAIKLAEALAPALPHIDDHRCPSDPEVYSTAEELEAAYIENQ